MRTLIPSIAVSIVACVVVAGCATPDVTSDELASTDQEVVSRQNARRAHAEVVRDTAARRGLTNGVLLAGIAQVETAFAHCWSEATWACQGPPSKSCGGGPVIAGASDGPCSIKQGGLGMFQFDGGTFDQTLRRDGADILELDGNVSHVVDFVTNIVKQELKLGSDGAAIDWMNGVKVANGDQKFEQWKSILACRYNGNCGSGRAGQGRKYGDATLTMLTEFGAGFWSKVETKTPQPAPPEPPAEAGPSAVDVSWNVSAGEEYSLDIFLRNGQFIGPCVDEYTVGSARSFRYSGRCVSPNIDVPVSDVLDFQICSAKNDDWKNARCVKAKWDGTSSSVHVDN